MIEKWIRFIDGATQIHRLLEFKFAKGGTLDLNLTLTNSIDPPLGFYWCTYDEIAEEVQGQRSFEDFCKLDPMKLFSCLEGEKFFLNATENVKHIAWTAKEQLNMWLITINCNQQGYRLEGSSVASNPNGEYLSLNEVPFKLLHVTLATIWAVLVIFWTIHWLRYRFFNIKLQAFLTLLPFFQMGSCILSEYWYRVGSETGVWPNQLFYWIFLIVNKTATMIVFLTLMYVAEGWGVLKYRLERKQQVWSLALAYWLASFLMHYYPSFVFVLVFFYLLILRYIFRAHSRNMALLSQQYECIQRAFPDDAQRSPCYEKMLIYRNFSKVVVTFIAIDIIFRWWANQLLTATPWVSELLNNAMLVILACALGWIFRLRPFYPHFFMIGEDTGPQVEDQDMEQPLINRLEEWRPSSGYPKGFSHDYDDWLVEGAGQIALVENIGANCVKQRYALAVPNNS